MVALNMVELLVGLKALPVATKVHTCTVYCLYSQLTTCMENRILLVNCTVASYTVTRVPIPYVFRLFEVGECP